MEEIITETPGTVPETINNEPSQDPLDQEIEREKGKGEGRTEPEKAAFSLKKNADRVRELGLDPLEVLGVTPTPKPADTNDDVPEWFKKIEAGKSAKTALELADMIDDPKERELVRIKLETVITSGSPEERLRVARAYVNSVKNGQIVEEIGRMTPPRHFSSGSGAPANKVPTTPELTADEQQFTKAPFNMSATEIIAKRVQA